MVDAGLYQLRADMSQALLRKVLDGLESSVYVPRRILKYYDDL